MKTNVGAPLLTLAIFFSFIELSSQYNKTVLVPGHLTLPDNKDISYTTYAGGVIQVKNGKNRAAYGLLDKNVLVCILDTTRSPVYVRALLAGGKQVKATTGRVIKWTPADSAEYGLIFDQPIQ
ncbi:uncharacterized protein LOC117173477 [Belonocnema kinseyi]|uniref:uncharacterized protein LOC117173477 n=1 Tax=Belonocnema kinseyi TaxID=2817044 RepID=UPI00143DDDE8|nr:uncharacterized protein LOC117173477 [Belonocnema kinseyi]XP_033217971.1 uncharacterized protein LOC117173477 [Belonocnema kinseyi]